MKKTLIGIVCVMGILLTSCERNSGGIIVLNPTTLTLKVGDIATIDAGTATNVEWTSSNTEVATIYHGVVTAVAIGKTVITAKSGGASATAIVYVTGSDGSSLRISPALVNMSKGETYQLSYGNTYDLPVTWSSSNEAIATVSQTGLVTAKAAGNATISLSTNIETVTTMVAVAHAWGEYQLVWSDEFNSATLDESVWTIQTGGGGWGNQESQHYTERTENIRVQNGCLEIEARKEEYGGNSYTSGRIMSKGKKEFTYGKLEARISLPSGGGLWPAFWTLGNKGSWPNCGEIDIMEYVGNVPNRVLGTLHTVNDRSGSKSSRAYWGTNLENNFHTYGVEWVCEENNGKDVIRFYVDGEVYSEQVESVIDDPEYWPFNRPNYFIINMAVGGTLGGAIDNAIFNNPCIMYVDWVRVYQRQEIQ